MNLPHYLTLGEAARLTGKSKTTISNAVKKGKVSGGNRGVNNEYQIDPSELFRVYPMISDGEQVDSLVDSQNERHKTPQNDTGLQAAIDALKLVIEEKDKSVSRAEETAEHWRTEYQRTQNQLTDQRSEAEKAMSKLVEIEAAPKSIIKRRKLTLRERFFGGEVVEVEEVA